MKKYLSFVLIIIMLLFVACSKNSSSNPVSAGEQPATENIYIILVSPITGASDQSTSVTFSWSGNAETYDVYLGTSSSSLSKIASDLTTTSYSKSALSAGTTYYWKVIGKKDSKSAESVESGVRSFTTKSSSNVGEIYTNTIGMEFVLVKAGTFQMGSK